MSAWTVPGYTEARELGSGGSGRVVLAVHDGTGIPVAVKYLSERMRTDASFVRDFRAEARLLGALRSPYVVGLYEYVEAPGGAAIVMELVDGVALRALLAREGSTGPEAALVVLKGSLLGLAAAHRAGVVHRDYKPENVLVSPDGHSKLVDFGIAVDDGSRPGVAGTPAYMAPEQWNGEPASPAADVYAATATFFECLTGRKPYSGENFAELALQHLDAPVPDAAAPEPLRPLIRRGLAKHPEERPGDAAEFVTELETAAAAGYGPDWEERGKRRLAALVALLPLLLPSGGSAAEGTTALATTRLPEAPRRFGRRGRQGVLAGAAALVLAVLITLGARAGGAGPEVRTTDRAFAVTTAGPVEPPSPTDPVPSSEVPGSATPTATATTPDTSASASGTADPVPAPDTPTPTAPPGSTAPPTSAPPTTVSPSVPPTDRTASASPSSPAPVGVRSVSVTSLRDTGDGSAEATFTVTTDGPGPVTLVVAWYSGNVKGDLGTADGSAAYRRSGATRYTLTLTHAFRGGCYWGVRATTDPAAANGGSSQQVLTRRCTLT
ncbi:serine/threonine protein kinase [Streptomyces sp. NBC_01216]|uniref:serine/threonine-protein kinase n=1 Tax=Streptomyces sp. NBC_01216 TaxID=2903778 RepID=UPI002E12164A|nr:serine/threonine protein kinase [Streptomyces sp. NBC_01216]